MKKLAAIVILFFLLVSVVPVAAKPGITSKTGNVVESPNGVYIVQMINDPVVAYKGDIKGLKATAPQKGQKIDPYSTAVVTYTAFLNGKHDAAVAKAGGQKLYDYNYTYNGFAAKLSLEQANKMVSLEGVVAVSPDQLQTLDTSSTPDFLGLTAPGGLWDQLGGVDSAGEDVIIGIVDGGIWPESLSFSDRTGVNGNATKTGKLSYQQIPGWHGKCVPGEAFNASMCNQKLIGAQYFNAGWGGNAGIDAELPWEFNSPRDFGGHGTHTASTAGGNNNVPTNGVAAAFGPISGIAPRARIAAYKVCWQTPEGGSCYNSDSIKAIDQAVADGVDVINFSISGTRTNFADPTEIAFLFAADAGVFVAASAGNSGPASSTVAHPGPWLTTVAAGTHNRSIKGGSVTLGNGNTYEGIGYLRTAGPAPLIDAAAAGLPGADAFLSLCFGTADDGTARLDPAMVSGKIVVCERGSNVLVNKAAAVKEAGGVGMVLVNVPGGSNTLPFVAYAIPAVHLTVAYYDTIKNYAATTDATATINAANIVYDAIAPLTASFSSRGPLVASGDLLKPDLIAPGQDILAAVAPPGNDGQDFDIYSGTSMSSPHVAGLAALLMDLHPDWTPMMVKSALMTSAYDVLDGGSPAPNTNPILIFRQGAGHVQPNSAADPGLVFDSGWYDWLAFLCGTSTAVGPGTCNALVNLGYSLDPSNLNVASIAIADLPGSQTVTRTVTNVGAEGTYTFSFKGAGITASVSPASFTLKTGEKQTLQITITKTTAALNDYTGGQLTWSDGMHSVRIPVVVKPVVLGAPAEVSGSYRVVFGYDGAFSATARGLVPATTFDGSISTGEQLVYEFTIPAGTTYARFSLFDANVSPASDLDLYIFNSSFTQVGGSGGPTSNEVVNLNNPEAGTYYALVDGYATANPSTFTLFAWALGSTDEGNMTVSAPTTAVFGESGAIDLAFNGLTSGTKYLGSIVYDGTTGMPSPTIVRYDAP